MPTVKHTYSESKRGKKVIKSDEVIKGLTNPHVGKEWDNFLQDVGESEFTDGFYYVAYIIEEYGDEIRDDLDGMEKDDLEEYVIAVEDRQALDEEEKKDDKLESLLEDANAAEKEKIIQEARDTLDNSSIEDSEVHEDIVQD